MVKRKKWLKKWLTPSRGAFNTIIRELRLFEPDFKKYLRMDEETLEELVQKVGPYITKQTTHLRKPIAPDLKLAITLRYLATGEEFESLMFHFRVHSTTIAHFIPTVAYYIYKVLWSEYMFFLMTESEWTDIVDKTFDRWHFPHAWGAIDGCQGRISDGGVFKATDLYQDLENEDLGFPAPKPLPITRGNDHWDLDETNYSYYLVADAAFSLTKYMMKPYDPNKTLNDEQKIYNYRLCRFRRISENGFGILVNRFHLWLGRWNLQPEEAEILLLASVVLHNMLCSQSSSSYLGPGEADSISPTGELLDGNWRGENLDEWLPSVPSSRNRNPTNNAKAIRDGISAYFGQQGSVPWQWKCLS